MLPSVPSLPLAPRLPPSGALYRGAEPSALAQPLAPAAAHGVVATKQTVVPDALVPKAPAPPPPGRAKSNSERGKEFRAKRKKYEGELEADVYRLRAHIAELDVRKSVWEKQFLDARHTDAGSLVQLVREYFALFRFGLRDPAVASTASMVAGAKRALEASCSDAASLDKVRRQEGFIAQVMDSDALVGEQSGPAASLAQWRMYTISHDSLRNEPYHIASTGTEENPCIEVLTNIYGRISRDTIKYMFPGALHDEALIQKFLHHDVVYKSTFRFHFTDDNRIAIETADIGIVEGLLDAGFALDDISRLMQTTVLTPQCMIPEPIETEPRTPSPPPASRPVRQISPTSTKLSLTFLLGSDEDELRPDERVQEIVP